VQRRGQVAGSDQGDVIGGPCVGQRTGQQPVEQGGGRLGTQRCGSDGQVVQALVDDLTAALN
jgi:hypothetical protein